MKKKILSLLAAFFMLFGTSAMAQVDSTLEGDVNGDGVVDIADITAVIAIIKQNAEANPTYYWYVGTEKLASDSEVESKGIQISSSSQITNPLTWTSSDYIYFIYPTEFGTAKIVDEAGDDIPGKAVETLSNVTFTKYKGWRFNKYSNGVNAHITFIK